MKLAQWSGWATVFAVLSAADAGEVLSIDGPNGFANYGTSLAGAGDLDHDGTPDVVIGALQAYPALQFPGGVFVHSGATGAVLRQWAGPHSGSSFGLAVDSGVDVNGDGTTDVLVGAPHYTQGALLNHGLVQLFSGANGGPLFSGAGESLGDVMGSAVAIVGDVDADGFVDLMGGAPLDDDFGGASGSIRIWSGSTGVSLLKVHGQVPFAQYGNAISGAGDFNQDGFDDALVGAWNQGSGSGFARVIDGTNGAPLKTWLGSAGDQQGYAVARIGDVDGDGIADLALGAPVADANGVDSGVVLVCSGVGGATLATIAGASAGDLFGWRIAGLDADSDGVGDVIALAVGPRQVRIHSGATGLTLQEISGSTADVFGSGLAGVGDLDGDGYEDAAIGAPAADPGGVTDAGNVTVYSGCVAQQPYGDGCPGTQGKTPTIAFSVCPSVETATTFDIADALGSAPGVMLIGMGQASIPAAGGCTLNIQTILFQVGVTMPASGALSIPFVIPASAAGVNVTFQALVADGGVSQGFSASRGLELQL